jgi:hypothetical protein
MLPGTGGNAKGRYVVGGAVRPVPNEVTAAHGDKELSAIDLRDRSTGGVRRVDCGGVFVFIGADAKTGCLPESIARDDRGCVCTGETVAQSGRWPLQRDPTLLETSVPGIFACGDVRSRPSSAWLPRSAKGACRSRSCTRSSPSRERRDEDHVNGSEEAEALFADRASCARCARTCVTCAIRRCAASERLR